MNRQYEYKDVLIRIENLGLSFNGVPVLANLSATVRDLVRPGCVTGQVIGILGPSGVGKTQVSRCLAGLQEPTSGTITVGSKGSPVAAGAVGYVPQNYPLLRHRTVLGNLLVAASRSNAPKGDAEARAMEYLRRFELADKASAYPAELSGGQRQRVAIAQQLLCSEHYLILDEPTTGLDPVMKDKVCYLIKQIADLSEENTIFVVTHDIPVALSIADRLWLIGRERDAEGKSLGARILYEFDLIEHGLAWEEDPRHLPAFDDLSKEIRGLFPRL